MTDGGVGSSVNDGNVAGSISLSAIGGETIGLLVRCSSTSRSTALFTFRNKFKKKLLTSYSLEQFN